MNVERWQSLLEGMIDAVWLVDPLTLHIVAANRAATSMLNREPGDLIGRVVTELAATPEDQFFWKDVAAGLTDHILSETLILLKDGSTVPVERRVSRVKLSTEIVVYQVAISNRAEQRRVEQELENLLAELRATLDSTADGILVTDTDGGVRGYNQRFAELWDMPNELMIRKDDAATHAWMTQNVLNSAEYESRIRTIANSALTETRDVVALRSGRILERVSMPQLARGRPTGRVYSFRDITQQLANESRLQLAAEVFESSLDAICVADPQGVIAAANPSFERLYGLPVEQIKGRELWKMIRSTQYALSGQDFLKALAHSNAWEGEASFLPQSGDEVPILASLVRVVSQGKEILHYIAFLKDTTEKLAALQRIEELAFSDPLTSLPNRALLHERIDFSLELCEREHKKCAIVFIDLDHFKKINDSMGHIFGDQVLVEVAKRLRSCLRQSDTAARTGGDEFVLLLHDTDALGAEAMVNRVLQRVCEPVVLGDLTLTITGSIGIAVYPFDGTTRDELIKNADTAMYQVKERGRFNFRFYQRQMNVDSLSHIKLDSAMRAALAQGDFLLRYQPQIDLESGRIIGAEALLRWHSKELGDISPGQFIPVAEETGFIIALGQWVLTEAVAQAARWQAAGIGLVVAINVSALQFQSSSFIDSVAAALSQAGLEPCRLELELTESILIHDINETLARLQALAQLGISLSIDDFGTGYSSLTYLKRFPVQKLKIDRSFVNGLPDDESDLAIARAIIQLGLALRLRVIAEGVETERQKDCLQDLGCHEYQGYFFAAALDSRDLEAMLTEEDKDLQSGPGKV
ncbi:bifunctional diguanylate cyclase/phosphodiesterase [Propionivibrio sp.]|uniref:sensor domain-containing protein n=1 Tax=Propionivibrio sp. TaxID=2212460 RepID=UPI0025FE6A77|nr:bifunctional diguanylate cyclase/phosphodiesterase [Propionivibrio sp.]MBK7355202.1 EAL domain-containing protein [Propionivibrio sp.]